MHYIIWEQYDWQIPSLASRIHQTLDKTCLCWLLGSSAQVYAVKEDYHAVLPS
jgi:hypothetical protein